MTLTFLWYVPNTIESGHRGDDTKEGWGSLDFSAEIAQVAEAHGFEGALVGTGWGRPDTFTICTALAVRTRTFRPLAAIRPGYWHPAQFACAAATLDQLSGGRLLVNIVTGRDNPRAYGDYEERDPVRYARTREFMQIVRRLWNEKDVTYSGEHFRVEHSTVLPRPHRPGGPPLYFGGASAPAEEVAAAEADVQLFWGEPLAGAAERIDRLRRRAAELDRARPLEFGLRITIVVRETSAEAWRAAEEKLRGWEGANLNRRVESYRTGQWSEGERRLKSLMEQAPVLDRCLWTAPAKYGTGAALTWLVGSPEDIIASLQAYVDLGMTHFILSDTPYKDEAARIGDLVVRPMQQTHAARTLTASAD